MEIVNPDGSTTRILPGQTRELGRVNGLNSSDKAVSRRHLLFSVPHTNKKISIQFEVLGRNPIYVSKNDEVKIFRRFERGEMGNGDMFCVCAKAPVWYTLRQIENGREGVRGNDSESELAANLESGDGFDAVEDLKQEGADISDIDPVKGHRPMNRVQIQQNWTEQSKLWWSRKITLRLQSHVISGLFLDMSRTESDFAGFELDSSDTDLNQTEKRKF